MTAILASTASDFIKNLGVGLAGTAFMTVAENVKEPRLVPTLLQGSITGNLVGAAAFALCNNVVFALEKRLIERITTRDTLRKPLLIIAAVIAVIAALTLQVLTFQILRERAIGSLTPQQQDMFSLAWSYFSYPPGVPCEDCHAIRVVCHYLNSLATGSQFSSLAGAYFMYDQVKYILLQEWKVDAAKAPAVEPALG